MDASLLEELEKLRRVLVRVATLSIVLLYFALMGLSTAMERVNSAEVREILEPLQGFERRELSKLGLSYVFSQQVAYLTPGDRKDDALGRQVADRLESLAQEWFSIRFEVLGTDAQFDLRPIAPCLPFAVVFVAAYLAVTYRKIRLLESHLLPAEPDKSPANDAAVLLNRHYQRHPHLLLQWVLLGAGLAILLWLLDSFWDFGELVSSELQRDYTNAVLFSAACAVLYSSAANAAIGGNGNTHGWAAAVGRLLDRGRLKLVPAARSRFRRMNSALGGGLIVLTLFTLTATSCSQEPATGLDYALAEGQTTWFNSEQSLLYWISDAFVRPMYVAAVLFAVAGLWVAVWPWRVRPPALSRFAHKASRFAAIVSRSVVLLVVCTVCFFCRSDELSDVGTAAPIVVWLASSVWLWLSRKAPDERAYRWRLLGTMLVPAALTFGVEAGLFLYERGLIGVPLLLIGAWLQYRGFRQAAMIDSRRA
jgi:hypothetical protein